MKSMAALSLAALFAFILTAVSFAAGDGTRLEKKAPVAEKECKQAWISDVHGKPIKGLYDVRGNLIRKVYDIHGNCFRIVGGKPGEEEKEPNPPK